MRPVLAVGCLPHPDLIPTLEETVPARAKYITPDAYLNQWRVWRMTHERVPIPLGRFQDIAWAIYTARK